MTPIMPERSAGAPIGRAPLVPIAFAWSLGIALDRLAPIAVPLIFGWTVVAFALWATRIRRAGANKDLVALWAAVAAVGALRHHVYLHAVPADDIRHRATAEGRIVHLRGIIEREPTRQAGQADPLRSFPSQDSTRFVVRVLAVEEAETETPASGLVQATVAARLETVHVGDEVRLVGKLVLPEGPANPGGQDYGGWLRDQGIGATLQTPAAPQAATLVRRGWPSTLFGWLAVVRDWGARTLAERLPPRQQALAQALLLGDGSAMAGDDWEKYLRTGVIHVLAISGQHLVVLAGFFGIVARVLPVRRRVSASVTALLLLTYALLTGGRPPAMRAAWAVLLYCGGILLNRPVLPANVLAFAWLGISFLNPADIFNTGCQLSFVAVAVLFWGTGWLQRDADDPLEKLVDAARSPLLRGGRALVRWIVVQYLVNALVWAAVAPLVAGRFHVVSPSTLLVGPPVVWLSSLALLFGFGLLLTAPLGPLGALFAQACRGCLVGCEAIVDFGLELPGSCVFVADVPELWLAVFYAGLSAVLLFPVVRAYRRTAAVAGAACLLVGLLFAFGWMRSTDLRIAFVDVGHGGCTVLETPDGKVRVYDAGSLVGPDVTRRRIAPYLWSRGIRRIDELLLSHADLDHYNAVPALAERFPIGAVVLTPTFAERETPGARKTIEALRRGKIPFRVVKAGDAWEETGVTWSVLHPPDPGPEGPENVRSLVLRVKSDRLTLLLTGDLEGEGLAKLLSVPREPVDVLQAPHHGSRVANVPALAAWARPRLVAINQGAPKAKQIDPYAERGAAVWSTWRDGTITILRRPEKIEATTFRSRLRLEW